MTDRPIRLILDTSAILAFARGSVDVGETLREVGDDSLAGLPALCLAEARTIVHDVDLFDLLVAHPATTVVSTSSDWWALGMGLGIVGPLPATTAAQAAHDGQCALLTAVPRLYGGLDGGGPVIAIN